MKLCPHCGKEVRLWRVFQTKTIYRCPSCGKNSKIALSSQALLALLVVVPILPIGVGFLSYLNVQSWVMRILVIVPMAFAASLLLKYLLACFGRFDALISSHDE